MGRQCIQNGKGRSGFKILMGKPTGKIPSGSLGVDGRTILEWTLNKYMLIRGFGLIRLRIGIIREAL